MSLYDYGVPLERKDKRSKKLFFGKYRALVTNNNDSKDKMGRIKVICPAVLGDSESDWCNPCLPYGGDAIGMAFIPKVGDSVWVEFEEGDPDKPIWVGNWWGLKEMPSEVYKKIGYHHIIETKKTKIYFNDETGVITIQGDGKIVIDGAVEITDSLKVNGRTI